MNLLLDLNSTNLSTHLILPLLKLRRIDFTEGNLENTYITLQVPRKLVVKVSLVILVSSKAKRSCYLESFISKNKDSYFIYSIPREFQQDTENYVEGKYSKFSEKSVSLIRKYSGLKYRELDSDRKLKTDPILAALTRDPQLIRLWERILYDQKDINSGQSTVLDDMELLPLPSEQCFLDLKTIMGA